MSHQRSAGFAHAPISRTLVVLTLLAAATSIFKIALPFSLRVLLQPFMLTNPFDVGYVAPVLYIFRQFERRMSTPYFAIYLLASLAMSEGLCAAIAFASSGQDTHFTIGPYGVLFALFTYYHFEVPITSRTDLFGLDIVSNKSYVYLLALYLLARHGRGTEVLTHALAGTLAGVVLMARDLGGFASAA